MQYFYAYHGPQNKNAFNYSNGYGVGQAWRTNQVNVGDRLFVIQKLTGDPDFRLCGLFEIISTYEDHGSTYPYRVKLENLTNFDVFPPIDEALISKQLPISDRNEPWTNFKRHFCYQGASFQSPLNGDIVSVLNLQISMPDEPIDATIRREDGLHMVKFRKDQKRFRDAVMANWDGKCAVTGSSLAVEACHIISHADMGLPSVENGIALAADLHALFDSDHLSFINNRVILSESARLEPRYKEFHEAELRTPLKPVNLPVK